MFRRIASVSALTLAGVLAATEPAAFQGPSIAGHLSVPPKLETSGLAISRRNADVLWTHDDSGGAAALYAATTTGAKIGVLHIQGVKNEDWEDLASFELDGKAWLAIADTGDNDAQRPTVLIHLVAEPSIEQLKAGGELSARPARTLRVRYEDGPHDCESIAVDAAGRAIYLLTKRDAVPRLYRVDLAPKDGNAITIARHVAQVSRVPQPTKEQRKQKNYLGRRRGEVTAMDFTADGSAAVVLTYGSLLYYARHSGEPWAEALARDPVQLESTGLLQVEAACFSADGKQIYVAAEATRTFVRYDKR